MHQNLYPEPHENDAAPQHWKKVGLLHSRVGAGAGAESFLMQH
jgi:hypothetical protein